MGILLTTWHLGPLLRVNPSVPIMRIYGNPRRVKGLRSKLSPKELREHSGGKLAGLGLSLQKASGRAIKGVYGGNHSPETSLDSAGC